MIKKIEFIEAGHSFQIERLANTKSGGLKPIRFPATVAIIEHHSQGILLFDTGLTPRLKHLRRHFPERLVSRLLPFSVEPEDTALYQLKKMGIKEKDVSHVVLSHFHSDHIAGVLDFPKSNLVYSKKEYDSLVGISPLSRLRHAFIPELLPADFKSRYRPLGRKITIPTLGKGWSGYDLFLDGSIFVVPLPGHSVGHMGLYLPDVSGKSYFLIGDASYLHSAVACNTMPAPLASMLIFDDSKLYQKTLGRIHDVMDTTIVVPCHCHETLKKLQSQDFKS
jgi:glyoxylase-like metal-dependent hydrolase (beta-lactamase superfamily II)